MADTFNQIFWQRVKAWKLIRFQWWIWLPLSLAMSFIYSTGPQVQTYIFALITSDDASIYGSAYQHQMVRLPKLDDWFDSAVAWPHVGIGFIVVALSGSTSGVKQLFHRIALFGFLTLLLFDIGYGLVQSQLSYVSLFQNLIANFLGAIAAAALAVILVEAANYGFSAFNWNLWARRAIAGAVVLLCGALALCSIFYSTDFFYRPRPTTIDLTAGPPSYGFLIAEAAPKGSRLIEKGQEDIKAPFSLLSTAAASKHLNWRTPEKLRIDWSSKDPEPRYKVAVSLYSGCSQKVDVKLLPRVAETDIKFDNVRTLSFWNDWGIWDATVTVAGDTGKIKVAGIDASFFSIKRNVDGKALDLEQFVPTGKTTKAEVDGGSERINIFMLLPPIAPEGLSSTNSVLHLDVDGKAHELDVIATLADKEKAACTTMPAGELFSSGKWFAETPGLGVNLEIIPEKTLGKSKLPSPINLAGSGGWISLDGVDPSDLDAPNDKRINMISITGDIKSVDLGGTDISAKAEDNFLAYGDRLLGGISSGSLKISGTADLLWINSARASKTKWEVLPLEYKLLVLTALGSALLLFARRVATIVIKDEDVPWLLDGHKVEDSATGNSGPV